MKTDLELIGVYKVSKAKRPEIVICFSGKEWVIPMTFKQARRFADAILRRVRGGDHREGGGGP